MGSKVGLLPEYLDSLSQRDLISRLLRWVFIGYTYPGPEIKVRVVLELPGL